MHYDVFNGDADGILSLVQLRLANPLDSQLITGVKRDIELVQKVDLQQAKSVTVLDISMQKNIDGLNQILAQQVPVEYFDHHRSGDIPQSEFLTAHIDTDANVCTALLVDHHLNHKYPLWATAAAYGDNLIAVADKRCQLFGIKDSLQQQLKQLGICVNYNGYGRSLDDLHFAPAELFKLLVQFESPQDLFADKSSVYYQLNEAYQKDIALADNAEIVFEQPHCKVLLLPDEPWSHRVSGVYGNELANGAPDKVHAVLTAHADGNHYTVSVRAPLNNKQGADEVCSQFDTGGGRAGAAGINKLAHRDLARFIAVLAEFYG